MLRKTRSIVLALLAFIALLPGCVSSLQSNYKSSPFPVITPTVTPLSTTPVTTNIPILSALPNPTPSVTTNYNFPSSANLTSPTGVYLPGNIGPIAGSIDVPLNSHIEWDPSPGATGYDFKLATDPTFINLVDSKTNIPDPVYVPTMPLIPNTLYFWEERARYPNYVGDWGGSSFTTVIIITSTPSPIATSYRPSQTQATSPIPEDADSLVPTPGGVYEYKGDLDQTYTIPQVTLTFVYNNDTFRFTYRAYIETSAGKTRNNILTLYDSAGNFRINAIGPDSSIGNFKLSVIGLPSGITYDVGEVIQFHISNNISPAKYTFSINVLIGETIFTLPCTINVL